MSTRYVLYAPNVHQGGGKSLLLPLLEALQKNESVTFILDQRLQIPEGITLTGQVYRIAPTLTARLTIEWKLRKLLSAETVLLSVNNLPPLLAHKGEQHVFVQNRYLVDPEPSFEALPRIVKVRLTLERWWLRSRAKYVDKFIVQTPTMAGLLTESLGMPATVLPFLAIDQPPSSKRGGAESWQYDFLYVASGEPHKNHKTLVEAWIELSKVACHPTLALTLDTKRFPDLCGWITEQVREYGLNITLVGELPKASIENLYRVSKALIYPSLYESFGLPLIEATRAGIPVLASDLPYVKDVIAPSATFDATRPDSIAKAVRTFRHTPAKVTTNILNSSDFLKLTLLALDRTSPQPQSTTQINEPPASRFNLLFPAVFATNTLAMTALLIGFGLAGDTTMAADIGIVQGATLALLYALSANARSLILNTMSPVSAHAVMLSRLLLLIPVSALAYWLSTTLANVNYILASALIVRRCIEWLGEVHLSEVERNQEKSLATKYLVIQIILLFIAFAWELYHMPLPLFGIFLWSLLPILFSARFIRDSIFNHHYGFRRLWKRMLPHFGSTAIIGIAVYMFRLLLLLILGKHLAGDLFTAFAIGGIVGSIFANALGPSIVLEQERTASRKLPSYLQATMLVSMLAGVALVLSPILGLAPLQFNGKSSFFWDAVGYSLLGGVLMVYAQLIRHRILQQQKDGNLFGPDTIINILIIVSIPILYKLFGVGITASLYLFNSALTLIVYWRHQQCEHSTRLWDGDIQRKLQALIAVLLLVPIFFQLGAGAGESAIHGSPQLPLIPIAVIACHAGILLLGNYRRASLSFGFLFFTFILMFGAAVVSSHGQAPLEQTKLFLFVQFIVPMFGMLLGQLYSGGVEPKPASLEAPLFYTLLLVVPLHLVSMWARDDETLSPYWYLFNTYQHVQFVPPILVAAFVVTLFRLWEFKKYRIALSMLALLMGVYSAASALAMSTLILGLSIFSLYHINRTASRTPIVLLLSVSMLTWWYWQYTERGSYDLTVLAAGFQEFSRGGVSYINITSGRPLELLIGHSELPSQATLPSSYGYYSDFIYNFGVLALLPLVFIVAQMGIKLFNNRQKVYASPGLVGLAIAVALLVFVDNSLSMGLQQPYSGIFTFFLCGILMARIINLHDTSSHQ